MKRVVIIIGLLSGLIQAATSNPSMYKAANSDVTSLTSYKSSSELSGATIFGNLQDYKNNPYGITLFRNGLSASFYRNIDNNIYTLGYGYNIARNSLLSLKYSTDFQDNGVDNLDVGLLLAYRYINFGVDFYNVSTNLSSWEDSDKKAGFTAFALHRNLYLSCFSDFKSFKTDSLQLTNLIGYNFSRNLSFELFLKYNTSDFSNTKEIGISASAMVTPESRFDVDISLGDNFNDGYNTNGAVTFFSQEEPTKTSLITSYLEITFPSKFITSENFYNSEFTYESFYNKLMTGLESPNVKGLVIKLPLKISEGLGVVETFREIFSKYRERGKEVYVYLESGGAKEFYLASVADSIYVNPSSYNIIRNPYLETRYYKGLFDKLGVKFEYIRYAEYKSAVEPYAFDSMSSYARANKKELLDDIVKNLQNKKIDFKQLTEKVMITPKDLIDSGYVDDTLYWDQVIAKVSKKGPLRKFQSVEYNYDKEYKEGVIAIVNFDGAIIPGNNIQTIWGSNYLGSESFSKMMNALEANVNVKGIIIKMNSPGGSAVASDIIYHNIEKIKKPVYTYIENVGASGGYYAASGTDKIYASKNAIIGSIGIYAGKPDITGLFNKLGIKNEKVMPGSRDDMFSVTRSWNDEDYKILNSHLRYYYDRFLAVVAKNRKITADSVETMAGGRIYSGSKGFEVGLIDEVTTLDKVISDMKSKVGDENTDVVFLSSSTSFTSKVMNSFIPSLKINETLELMNIVSDEEVYMIEPFLDLE